jgi:single stranded DNA-binding protein
MRIPYRNYVRFAGFIGNDVTLRKLESGDDVCSIRIGSKHSWKDAKGKWHETTEWATAVFYRQDAVDVHAIMKKGGFIDVEARKHTRKWTDKPGGPERRTEELIVQSWQPIDMSHIRQQAAPPVNDADAQQGVSPGRSKRQPTYDFSK